MLQLDKLEFTLESKWTGRHQKTPLLSVSRKNASLNVALISMINGDIKNMYYQVATVGDKNYLILGFSQFANQSYKCHPVTDPSTGKVSSIKLMAKDMITKFGPTDGVDKVRYDLNPVPIQGEVIAFEMVKVFSDSITTIEH